MSELERRDELTDWLLGELDEQEGRELARAVADDSGLSQEVAEMRCLFDDLRQLSTESTGRVGLAVREAIDRRRRLRQSAPRFSPVRTLVFCAKVAAVAATIVAAVLVGEQLWFATRGGAASGSTEVVQLPQRPRPGADSGANRNLAPAEPEQADPTAIPMFLRADPSLASHYRFYARSEASPVDLWFLATNGLASLRREFHGRFNPVLRQRALRVGGGSRYLAARIETLSGEIAAKIDRAMAAGNASTQDAAMSLRALMAGGSSLRIGEHREAVRRCADFLAARLPELEGGELATALSGLMDLAVVAPRRTADLVVAHTRRLTDSLCVEDVFNSEKDRMEPADRPSMLNWRTSADQLADAGQVLRLAAAFRVDSRKAQRARNYLAALLAERVAMSNSERPDLLAAQLYGFADLVDRDDIERRLRLWHARDLVPEHYVALHHVSWSRFPLRSGWADFQREMRAVATLDTPESPTDAAALLLALAVNYAAPGSHELLGLAMR